MVLEGAGIWFEVEVTAGGGGRPGLDLIGGGRSGSMFAPVGLEERKENQRWEKEQKRSIEEKRAAGFCLCLQLTHTQQI